MLHKFIFDGTKIVIDVNSGAVHVVDDLTWDILALENNNDVEIIDKLKEKYPVEEISEALDELKELKEDGLLDKEDEGEKIFTPPRKPVVKALCLHVAHDCNLRCKYCFAGTGPFGGSRELMSPEVGKKALDFLIEASGPRKHVEVDFFGGEPLMNFSVVKELVRYGRNLALEKGKIIKFTLTTNGVLINKEIEDYLNREEISLVLSLDGRPEVHDKMRPFKKGKGSYDLVLPKIKSMVESRDNENYYVRGTFTRYNRDFSEDVLHLAGLGFRYISVEPVVAPADPDCAFNDEDIPVLEEEYEKLARKYLEFDNTCHKFDFFHFNIDLEQGPCLIKRLNGCGAGHEYMAVTPDGHLYPCHQFVGRKEFLLGSVFEGIKNWETIKKFQQAHVYNKKKCRSCWAKFYCSGGCHANAHAVNNDIFQPYEIGCRLEKKRLECALYINIKKAGLA